MDELTDNLEALRARLVAEGEAQLVAPRRFVPFTANDEADALLNDLVGTPHAFVFACLVDRQVKAELAWKVPLHVRERVGSFEMDDLVQLRSDEWVSVLREPTPIHRFPEKMGEVLYRGTQRVADRYEGFAGKLWADEPPSARLVRRFLGFHGAGPKIATMATNILVRDFHVRLADHRYIDISADVQVNRVMGRLGFVEPGASPEEVIYAARELNPEFPGVFDLALWELGRETCRPKQPRCGECRFNGSCRQSAELSRLQPSK